MFNNLNSIPLTRTMSHNEKARVHKKTALETATKIIIRTVPNVNFPHFVHYMQYLFWAIDIVIYHAESPAIIVEPNNKSTSRYCNSFKNKIKESLNVNFVDNYENNDIDKEYKYLWARKGGAEQTEKPGYFILNNEKKEYVYYNWFPNNNSKKIKKICLNNHDNNTLTIGLINRKNNRVLTNFQELCSSIKKKFDIDVDVTYFEDKSFDYQINFFNNHKIIISPHGAQLCSTPFLQNDGLIIECVHKEWHPYLYFPGLSNTSNKYHAIICDDHSSFPQWWSNEYTDKNTGVSLNKKLNMRVNIEKVLNIIDLFLKNKKLASLDTYLF